MMQLVGYRAWNASPNSPLVSEDEGHSELADEARRLGKKGNYASQYKRRLREQGIVGDVGRGRICIELPMFKDYLCEQLL